VSNKPDDVKPRRPYRSERRRQQAEQTRGRVLDAAAHLFDERGFERTTVAAIAAEAGVAPETVYGGFGSKRALLGELIRRAARGAEEGPVPEQSGARAVRASADPHEQLRLFAADVVTRLERVGPLVEALASAARTDAELASLHDRIHADRLAGMRELVDALASNAPLRVDPEAAAETVWALASPELHRLLVRRRKWTRDRYRAWLADVLGEALLAA
jgi:AcrR family transcriptional regulator